MAEQQQHLSALHSIIQAVVRRSLFPQLVGGAATASAAAASTTGAQRPTGTAPAARHPSAKERRHAIARCRTLRGEIAAFEAAFTDKHGHAPKGGERFQLQAVYDEYRNLKVQIRDDAATHIQAVFRGHRARRGRGVRTSSGGTARPKLSSGAAAGSSSKAAAAAAAELAALRDEKAQLKRSLRAFDVQFAAAHGRPPSKAEKEHLRPQYTRYHELKQVMTRLEEAAGIKPGSEDGEGEGATTPADAAAASAAAAGHRPPSAVGAAGKAFTAAGAAAAAASSSSSSSFHDGDREDNRSRRSDSFSSVAGIDADGDEGVGEDKGSGGAAGGGAGTGSRPGSASSSSATSALKAEKKKLQSFLRDYEKSFQERWGRPVKLVKDIAPVMDKYQRYKQLKQLLSDGQGK